MERKGRQLKKNAAFFPLLLLCLVISQSGAPVSAGLTDGNAPRVNVLEAHCDGRNRDSAAIAAAIDHVPQDEKAVLVLKPGVWTVTGKLVIPANISLQIEEGAVLDVDFGSSIVIDGAIEAGQHQIFSGA